MDESPIQDGHTLSAVERFKAIRWWRSISPVLQHNATNLSVFITARLDELDAAWDLRFDEACDRLTSFVSGLEREHLGASTDPTFVKVAEKFRRRELRALLMSHLAAEMVAKARARAQPLLEALDRLDPDDHRTALAVGDLRGFDVFSRSLFPDAMVSAVGWAVDEAVETRSMAPVDRLMTEAGVSRVDDEFRNILAFDGAAIGRRLEQEIDRMATTIDLRGIEPVVHLPESDTPIVTRSESKAAQA